MTPACSYDDLDDSLNFTSIDEFKFCLDRHSEIEFVWKGDRSCI